MSVSWIFISDIAFIEHVHIIIIIFVKSLFFFFSFPICPVGTRAGAKTLYLYIVSLYLYTDCHHSCLEYTIHIDKCQKKRPRCFAVSKSNISIPGPFY